MRFVVILLLVLAARAAFGETPSVKEDVEDAGRSTKDAAVHTYDKAKDATMYGVGKALRKTGEGLNKAAEKIEGAGETVEKKVE